MSAVPFQTAAEVHAALPVVRAHLEQNGVLAHPTETVYGLGGRATHEALATLFGLKAREQGRPVLLLVTSRRMAEDLGLTFSPAATALADAMWPGALTLVLPVRGDELPAELRGPSGGVGVRWTAHSGMSALIAALGYPITSTSANRPGGEAASTAEGVLEDFGAARDLLVLDGGALASSRPSTVVDCTGGRPTVIREGAISLATLRERSGKWAP